MGGVGVKFVMFLIETFPKYHYLAAGCTGVHFWRLKMVNLAHVYRQNHRYSTGLVLIRAYPEFTGMQCMLNFLIPNFFLYDVCMQGLSCRDLGRYEVIF